MVLLALLLLDRQREAYCHYKEILARNLISMDELLANSDTNFGKEQRFLVICKLVYYLSDPVLYSSEIHALFEMTMSADEDSVVVDVVGAVVNDDTVNACLKALKVKFHESLLAEITNSYSCISVKSLMAYLKLQDKSQCMKGMLVTN